MAIARKWIKAISAFMTIQAGYFIEHLGCRVAPRCFIIISLKGENLPAEMNQWVYFMKH